MKLTTYIIFIITSLLVMSLYPEGQAEVQLLIRGGLDKNYDKIVEKSAALTDTEKLLILDANENQAVGPFFLNFCVGFGLGSYIQGDTKHGIIGTAGDLSGIILLFTGPSMMASAIIDAAIAVSENNQSKYNQAYKKWKTGRIIYFGGLGIYSVSHIYQMIVPWTFAGKYNKKLNNALLGQQGLGFNFIPYIDYCAYNNRLEPVYGAKLTLQF